jgi:hypothetical protein
MFYSGSDCLCGCNSDQEQLYIALVCAFYVLSMTVSWFLCLCYTLTYSISLSSVAMRNWGNEYVCMYVCT